MAKKKLGLEDLGGFVFSTDQDFDLSSDDSDQQLSPQEQELEAHYSKKGRGGKTVTVVSGFIGSQQELTLLGKELKKKCGVGGSVKDGEIIIQGEVRDKVMAHLKDKGYNVKRVGG